MVISNASPYVTMVDGVRLRLRVTPGARRTGAGGLYISPSGCSALKLSVAAIAEDNRANKAVRALLAAELNWPRSAIAIVAGQTSRDKVVSVTGDPAIVRKRLDDWLGAIAVETGAT